jgi:hypothetical protein
MGDLLIMMNNGRRYYQQENRARGRYAPATVESLVAHVCGKVQRPFALCPLLPSVCSRSIRARAHRPNDIFVDQRDPFEISSQISSQILASVTCKGKRKRMYIA